MWLVDLFAYLFNFLENNFLSELLVNDRPEMTIAVHFERKALIQQRQTLII